MSFIGRIFGTAAAETAKGLADGVGGLATSIRMAITGELSPDARAKLEELAAEAEQLSQQGQFDINKTEAAHKSLFVAGWRPFIGWICGFAMAWNFLVHPLVVWYMAIWHPLLELPPGLDLTQLYPVLLGILGLGAYRTYEKRMGVHDRH